jgi:hypothetical protein
MFMVCPSSYYYGGKWRLGRMLGPRYGSPMSLQEAGHQHFLSICIVVEHLMIWLLVAHV